MTSVHDRPTADEVLEAVVEFLHSEVAPVADARLRYHALVASNLLEILRRELAAGTEAAERYAADLRHLGVADEAELCAQLRSGELSPSSSDLRQVLRRAVEAKVAVSRPDHLERALPPHDPVAALGRPGDARR